MKKNNFFSDKQFGFISGRSTSLQLLKILDIWTEQIDNGASIDCIYMDFQKAFDTVPHRRLLNKLEAYNINIEIIKLIESFLSNRVQQVGVNGELSNWCEVTSGIPQGSVLGPLLFVIYINDLPQSVNSQAYLFADDTKIFRTVKNYADQLVLQNDLDSMNEWSERWLLRFHPDKCKHMHIGKTDQNLDHKYSLNQTVLETIDSEKDIGVHIDNELTFDKHVSEKVNKANSIFAMLRRSFQYMNKESFTPLYKTLVRTQLDYANSVWAPFKIKHIDLIENVQRRATKQLPGMKDMSYPERLKILKLPTLSFRRTRGDMIEVYKIVGEEEFVSHKKIQTQLNRRKEGQFQQKS